MDVLQLRYLDRQEEQFKKGLLHKFFPKFAQKLPKIFSKLTPNILTIFVKFLPKSPETNRILAYKFWASLISTTELTNALNVFTSP